MGDFVGFVVGEFQRTWIKLLTTASVTLFTYLIFCAATIALVRYLQQSGNFRVAIRSAQARAGQMQRELFHSLFSITIFQIAMAGSRVVAMGFGIFINLRNPEIPTWQFLISFPLIFVAHDAYFYWTHRLMHLSGFYRIMHHEHHKSFAPTALAAYSFAFLEAWIQGSFLVVYVLLFPANTTIVVTFVFVEIVYNAVIHSGVDPFPSWMVTHRYFGCVAASAYHDLHHRTSKWNFGLYFRFWDRLMGTEHPDFVRIHNHIHSAANHGDAYKLLNPAAPEGVADARSESSTRPSDPLQPVV